MSSNCCPSRVPVSCIATMSNFLSSRSENIEDSLVGWRFCPIFSVARERVLEEDGCCGRFYWELLALLEGWHLSILVLSVLKRRILLFVFVWKLKLDLDFVGRKGMMVVVSMMVGGIDGWAIRGSPRWMINSSSSGWFWGTLPSGAILFTDGIV